MLRRSLVALAALAAFAAPAALPAATAAQSMEAAVAADIDAWYAGQFANAGLGYSSPNLAAVNGETGTACGPVDPTILGPAAYCPLDATVYVAPVWEQVYSQEEWITILAHEWGHHAQMLVGFSGYPTDESELQADCLAGAYVADAEARGAVPAGTFTRGMGASIRAGAPPFLPDEADVHGTGAERGGSYMDGYMRGIGACGLL
jgi:predicted metalloprotease